MQKILVIEDEKALNDAIRLKLQKRGYDVEGVFNAEDGLKVLEKNGVSLIWLDLRLPQMDGISFLELIRNNEQWKDKKVVVVSVSGGFEAQEKVKQLGAIDYLIKNELKLDEIIEKITAEV